MNLADINSRFASDAEPLVAESFGRVRPVALNRKGQIRAHASTSDPVGYHKQHGKHRNRLNKGGTKRKGTLGYRTSASMGRVYNPREGKVNPPAPITKRTKPTLEYVMGDSWNTANIAETAREHKGYTWRGNTYPTWEAMDEAIKNQ
jgi:hypothetical protein